MVDVTMKNPADGTEEMVQVDMFEEFRKMHCKLREGDEPFHKWTMTLNSWPNTRSRTSKITR